MSRYRITDDEIRAEARNRGEPVDNSGDGKGLARWCVVVVALVALVVIGRVLAR